MIRNSILEKYRKKSKKELIDEEIYKNDSQYILRNYRPISQFEIAKLPQSKLRLFIDEMLRNRKVNSLLYSSSAKKESQKYLKANDLKSKQFNTKHPKRQNSYDLTTILFKKRQQLSEINKINEDIEIYKRKSLEHKETLQQKNSVFYNSIQSQKDKILEEYYKPLNENRLKNYKRTLKNCKSQMNMKNSFILPIIKLDINDVYSRLYHNQVYLKNTNTERMGKNSIEETESDIDRFNKPQKEKNNVFHISNVLNEGNGKEFTIKITDNMFKKCLMKNSGGPKKKSVDLNEMDMESDDNEKEKEDKKRNGVLYMEGMVDKVGNNNLHDAVKESRKEFIKYFLDKKISPNSKNAMGDTPLHIAMRIGDLDVIKMLLDKNGDITIKNNENKTPFDLASVDIKMVFNLEKKIMKKQKKQLREY